MQSHNNTDSSRGGSRLLTASPSLERSLAPIKYRGTSIVMAWSGKAHGKSVMLIATASLICWNGSKRHNLTPASTDAQDGAARGCWVTMFIFKLCFGQIWVALIKFPIEQTSWAVRLVWCHRANNVCMSRFHGTCTVAKIETCSQKMNNMCLQKITKSMYRVFSQVLLIINREMLKSLGMPLFKLPDVFSTALSYDQLCIALLQHLKKSEKTPYEWIFTQKYYTFTTFQNFGLIPVAIWRPECQNLCSD